MESVREVTREIMEDFIDHEMQKGNRITAINTRLRGLRVFFRFCQEREYMGDIGLKLLKEDETIKEPYIDMLANSLVKISMNIFASHLIMVLFDAMKN